MDTAVAVILAALALAGIVVTARIAWRADESHGWRVQVVIAASVLLSTWLMLVLLVVWTWGVAQ